MGVVPPDAGLQRRRCAETCRRARRAVRQRRGDDRLPGRAGRPVGPRRRRRGLAPDLMTFGKVMGGGFPAAAFGGRADVMALLAPAGPVYQAGTLSGNPVATAAGLATLRACHRRRLRPPRRGRRRRIGALVADALGRGRRRRTACSAPAPCSRSSSRDGAGARLRRRPAPGHLPRSPRSSTRCSTAGVYLPPSAFEAWFVSAAHDDARRRPGRSTPCPPRPAPPPRRRDDRPMRHAMTPTRPSCTCCATARCTTPRASSTAGCPATTSPSSAGRWPSGSPSTLADRDITHLVVLAARAGAGDGRAARRGARPRRSTTDDRLIEAGNVFEGKTFGVGDGVAAQAVGTGGTCATRSGRRGASPTRRSPRGCWPRSPTPATPPAATRPCCVCHQLPIWIARLARRGPAAVARPAQAPVLAGVAHVVHLRRRRPGVGVLRASRPRDLIPVPATGTAKKFVAGALMTAAARPTRRPSAPGRGGPARAAGVLRRLVDRRPAPTKGYVAGDGTVDASSRSPSGSDAGRAQRHHARRQAVRPRGAAAARSSWSTSGASWCAPCVAEAAGAAEGPRADRRPRACSSSASTSATATRPRRGRFERRFGVTYPSLDDDGGRALLALRGTLPPTADPTTLVLDRRAGSPPGCSAAVDAPTLRRPGRRRRAAEAVTAMSAGATIADGSLLLAAAARGRWPGWSRSSRRACCRWCPATSPTSPGCPAPRPRRAPRGAAGCSPARCCSCSASPSSSSRRACCSAALGALPARAPGRLLQRVLGGADDRARAGVPRVSCRGCSATSGCTGGRRSGWPARPLLGVLFGARLDAVHRPDPRPRSWRWRSTRRPPRRGGAARRRLLPRARAPVHPRRARLPPRAGRVRLGAAALRWRSCASAA